MRSWENFGRRLGWLIGLLALCCTGVHAESASAGAPSQCMQLGGSLACKPAIVTAWVYRADGKSYPDEASAYAHMLQTHAPKSVFSLTQRWGRGDRATQSLPPRFERSIEVASWKLFLHCIASDANAPCEPQAAYPGYQRTRQVICPPGFQFSRDAESPYCLPITIRNVQAASAQSARDPVATGFNGLAARSR